MRGALIGIFLACSSYCVRWVVGSRLRFLTIYVIDVLDVDVAQADSFK